MKTMIRLAVHINYVVYRPGCPISTGSCLHVRLLGTLWERKRLQTLHILAKEYFSVRPLCIVNAKFASTKIYTRCWAATGKYQEETTASDGGTAATTNTNTNNSLLYDCSKPYSFTPESMRTTGCSLYLPAFILVFTLTQGVYGLIIFSSGEYLKNSNSGNTDKLC
jgi:hypothetical protein